MLNKASKDTAGSILPSEFRLLWEEICAKMIECFVDFVEDSNNMHFLISLLVKLTHLAVDDWITEVSTNLNNLLNRQGGNKDYFYSLYTDNFQNLIEEKQQKKKRICKVVEDFKLASSNKQQDDFDELLESVYLRNLISQLDTLFFHAEFHKPQLKISFETSLEYRTFVASECAILDGFPRDNSTCLILQKPPMLKGEFAFAGCKTLVVMIEEPKYAYKKIRISSSKFKEQAQQRGNIKENEADYASKNKAKLEKSDERYTDLANVGIGQKITEEIEHYNGNAQTRQRAGSD